MLNSSIRPVDRMLSGATSPGQSGYGSDINEGVHYILRFSQARALSLGDFMSYVGYSLVEEEVLPLRRDAVGVFYTHTHTHIYIYMNRSTKIFIFKIIIYFVLTYVYVSSLLLSSENFYPFTVFFFFCLDVAQDHMNWGPTETRTHSCRLMVEFFLGPGFIG